ncbi:MAG: CotH kinase family protein [Bacteroidetes bacterium]|nr:CotH kinase family protein [Bacteroidota bacterium]
MRLGIYNSSTTMGDKIKFQYVYPRPKNITEVQKRYIREEFHKFEEALMSNSYANPETGYNKYIDTRSFVDNFIINELSKDPDAYRLSAYFYKDRNDWYNKIINGPVWDYDLVWFNADFGGGERHDDWQYSYGFQVDSTAKWPTSFWWRRLIEDPVFVEEINCSCHHLRKN